MSLGPGCRCGNGSPRNLEMFPKTGVEHGPYPRNHRIGGPTPLPIHDLTGFHRCLVSPELQEHAEVHPCLLGLSVRTHFSLWIVSPGSCGMGNCTLLPTTNSLRRNAGISGTGEQLSSRNSVAQSMRVNTSIAALSAPAPKNLIEWISSWWSAGTI